MCWQSTMKYIKFLIIAIVLIPTNVFGAVIYSQLNNTEEDVYSGTSAVEITSFTPLSLYTISTSSELSIVFKTNNLLNVHYDVILATSTCLSAITSFTFTGFSDDFRTLIAKANGSGTINSGVTHRLCLLPSGDTVTVKNYNNNHYGELNDNSVSSYWESTKIISVQPQNSSLIATNTPITIGTNIYVNEEDLTDEMFVRQTIQLTNAPVLGNIWGGAFDAYQLAISKQVFEYPITDSGYQTFSTTTTYSQIGNRQMTTEIISGQNFVYDLIFGDSVLTSTTTSFLVGTTTSGDLISQGISDSLGGLLSTGSTTVDSLNVACNPFSGNFDMVLCAYRLVVPDSQTANALFQETYDMVFSRAPFGYFTDFISIMSTSTIGSLTILNATVPNGLIGAGATITLDLTNVLDDVLYATTTALFSSGSATSTDTLFDQTYYYWRIIISILFVIYVIRRLLGAHIIPHNMFGEHGSLSDTSSTDDSYRLKEYLYKHRNEVHK